MNIFKIIVFTTGISLYQFSYHAFAQEQKRAMTFQDIIELKNVDWHTDISPDGK